MEPGEVNELQEHAEHARQPFDRKVGTSMAIIAAVLALVSVCGHITTTEELLNQQKESDQWAFYQAKSLRRYQSEAMKDLFSAMATPASAALAAKYEANIEKYKQDGEKIQEQALEFKAESELSGKRAFRLHFGEVFLEIAIVLASLALISKRPLFWGIALACASAGAVIGITTVLIH